MANLYYLRGVIASGPQEMQNKVAEAAEQLRDVVNRHGDEGVIALSLVVAEKAVEA